MSHTIKELRALLADTLLRDRHGLSRRLDGLARQRADAAALGKLAAAIEASRAAVARRRAMLPQPEFDPALPVNEKRSAIAAAIAAHPLVIICGETGSGKTTQIPKICLELGRGVHGSIGHTQPRRLAARSVANRLAQELHTQVGAQVGYRVRFTDHTSADSLIKVMTDGILLAETQNDRWLNQYDTLIIDEAHERSLNIDFLLGYVKRLLPRRPELKVIITSATLDAERFSKHFDGAPVIEVSGRLYPVEVRYRPLHDENAERREDEDTAEEGLEDAVLDAVNEVWRGGNSGDVLVFLPGEREIRETTEHLRKNLVRGAEILPLFARLSLDEQSRVFRPGDARRVVLATNVAETSLTVPGIRYVVDAGLARINRYSTRNKVEQLRIEPISQAAARQRAGRCGRVAAGVCIRLYSETDFTARTEYTDPEILRSSLAAVILRMAALELGEVEEFPFVDPPPGRAIADGFQLLQELGAVDDKRVLTAIGKRLAKLPIDPRLARMLVAAQDENCLHEILIIAAGLACQDPRERPGDQRGAADQAHARFADERSDFLAYLKLWQFFDEALKHKKSNRLLVQQCHEHFLSHVRLREWRDLHGQLAELCAEQGMQPNAEPAKFDAVHRALLAGLLGNIGCKTEEGDVYLGARGVKFAMHPGSALRKARPKWLVAGELIDTTKLYARSVAKIEPDWVEAVARGLTKSHYFDPHWEKSQGEAMIYERVTLYGLTLVSRRRVRLAPLDAPAAHELLIREGLVHGAIELRARFLEHNRQLIEDVRDLEHKSRRQDVLVDDEVIADFYRARVPADIVDARSFAHWVKEAERKNPQILCLTADDLKRHAAAQVTAEQYPDRLDAHGLRLALNYRFEPGHPLDGVTAEVPLTTLPQLRPADVEWLVPGMIREKLTWYVKSLPKLLRRHCVPVPDFVTAALDALPVGEEPLADALATYLSQKIGEPVSPDSWHNETVPAHLTMRLVVVDEAGAPLAEGRDLAALQRDLGQAVQLTLRDAATGLEKSGIKGWDFGELPERIVFKRGSRNLEGYPALVDEGDSVAIQLFEQPTAALAEHRGGVRRLLRLELKEQLKQLERSLGSLPGLMLHLRHLGNADDLREDLLTAICDRAFIGEDDLPRDLKAFQETKQRARVRLPAVAEATLRTATAIAEEYAQLALKLAEKGPAQRLAQAEKPHLQELLHRGCFAATPWSMLPHLPRYLKAIRVRLNKFPNDRDARAAASIDEVTQAWLARLEAARKTGRDTTALDLFRWQIEELRVSLFAQELRTPWPVSVKRLMKTLSDLSV